MYYIIAIAVFVLIFFLMSKLNKSVSSQYEELNKLSKERWKELANNTGLTFQEIEPPTDKEIHQASGFVITGTFNNFPVEIYFYDETRIQYQLGKTVYKMLSDHHITIQSPTASNWSVEPLSKAGATPTNIPEFDAVLAYNGQPGQLSPELLKSMAGSGWFHAVKQGNTLTFIDDYSQFISDTKGPRANMTAVHPIWLTSASNVLIDIPHSVSFLEFLTVLAQS